VLRALVLPTEPYVLAPVLALLIAWRLHASRPWDAVFVVLGPSVAVVANTCLMKPLFDRWKGDPLVYPSGHTVGMVATLAVVSYWRPDGYGPRPPSSARRCSSA
jgi:hypothetical protein